MPKVDCCGFPNRIGEIVVGGESLCLSLSREGATNLPRKTAHRPKKNSSGNSAKEVVWIIGKFRASTQKVKNGLRRSFEGWKTMAQATFRENSRANMPFFIENELLISQGLFFIFSLARTCRLQPGSLCSSDRVPKHSFFLPVWRFSDLPARPWSLEPGEVGGATANAPLVINECLLLIFCANANPAPLPGGTFRLLYFKLDAFSSLVATAKRRWGFGENEWLFLPFVVAGKLYTSSSVNVLDATFFLNEFF